MTSFTILSAVWLGLLAGGQHALGGPDHLAGVAPFAAQDGRRAWRVGFAWGLGHAGGALAAALLALLLRARIPGIEEQLSGFSDRIVGILMCVVGAYGISAAVRAHEHAHAHVLRRSPFTLGLFHGAGGMSHLFAVLPALGFPGVALPALYLAGYAAGSLALVTAFAAGIGRLAPESRPRARRRLLFAASTASVAVGLVWILRPA
jgi:hypothetical protein